MKEDQRPKNAKGQPHGLWKRYWNGELWYKCVFINGLENGFDEWYSSGKITHKNYHL